MGRNSPSRSLSFSLATKNGCEFANWDRVQCGRVNGVALRRNFARDTAKTIDTGMFVSYLCVLLILFVRLRVSLCVHVFTRTKRESTHDSNENSPLLKKLLSLSFQQISTTVDTVSLRVCGGKDHGVSEQSVNSRNSANEAADNMVDSVGLGHIWNARRACSTDFLHSI